MIKQATKELLYAVVLMLVIQVHAQAQSRFVSPIAGNYGKDFIIVNYVDWVADSLLIGDNHCSTKTYDGHQGTDFVIRNFRPMDSGRDVRAVDNGRVIFVKDGLFDREKTAVVSKLLGNYIGITHSGKIQTYYGHLRKGSVSVKVGDSVLAGQKIAQVGCSGNCSDAHLHFELWYDSSYYIDPFSGRCGNPTSYWLSQPAFDTSYGIWTSGMCNYVCTLDTLKEEPLRRDTFYSRDPAITYWNIQYGLRKGDSLRMDWYDPSGLLWFSYGNRLSRDWWYYYFWSYIDAPASGVEGKWSVKIFRENSLVATRPFYFYKKPTDIPSVSNTGDPEWQVLYEDDKIVISGGSSNSTFRLSDAGGRLIRTFNCDGHPLLLNKAEFSKGMYVITYISGKKRPDRKKLMIL
jgi:hypothetical protein